MAGVRFDGTYTDRILLSAPTLQNPATLAATGIIDVATGRYRWDYRFILASLQFRNDERRGGTRRSPSFRHRRERLSDRQESAGPG